LSFRRWEYVDSSSRSALAANASSSYLGGGFRPREWVEEVNAARVRA
jgi:hypothetical protein